MSQSELTKSYKYNNTGAPPERVELLCIIGALAKINPQFNWGSIKRT